MNLKKIFNANNLLCVGSIAANASSIIIACKASKNDKKDWKKYILPGILFFGGSAATVALTVRGNKAEAKVAAIMSAATLLETGLNNYKAAVSNVYGNESKSLIDRELVEMSGKEKPQKEERKDICWIGYGYNDYLLLSSEEKDKIEAELNKILRTEGSVTVAHFFDLCSQYNIIDDVIVQANTESSLYGWDTIMVGRRGYITISEEIYNDGDSDISYLDFDIQPSISFREDADIAPWEG